MNTSKIGTLLATTIIFLVIGFDKRGQIQVVAPFKYISKKACLKQAKRMDDEDQKNLHKGSEFNRYRSRVSGWTCLPIKWDGRR